MHETAPSSPALTMSTEESQSQRIETHDTSSSEPIPQSLIGSETEIEIDLITTPSDTSLSQRQETHDVAQESPQLISETVASCP